MSSGAPPMSAGSPATAISSMARWPMARPRMMFEGVPTYPDAGRFWEVCAKHKVNQFYTAPTAIRALMGQGPEWVEKYDLSSLRVLGTVGEPINPEAWNWYDKYVGKGRCPIVDTWWQTETGGHMITSLPGAIRDQARLGHAALLWRQARDRAGGGIRRCGGGNPAEGVCASPTAGPARCAPSGAITSASWRPISSNIPAITSPAMAAARCGWLLLDHRPGR
jgi:hypothetical protein